MTDAAGRVTHFLPFLCVGSADLSPRSRRAFGLRVEGGTLPQLARTFRSCVIAPSRFSIGSGDIVALFSAVVNCRKLAAMLLTLVWLLNFSCGCSAPMSGHRGGGRKGKTKTLLWKVKTSRPQTAPHTTAEVRPSFVAAAVFCGVGGSTVG